jgi:phage terminase small subunit
MPTKRINKSGTEVKPIGNVEQAKKDAEQTPVAFSYLNANQNAFVRAIMSLGNVDDRVLKAYRIAYQNKMSDRAARTQAYKVMATPNIRLALSECEKLAAGEAALDLASHLRELALLRDKAVAVRQYSAAITAEVSRGKAAGLYVQRMEVTGKDGAPLGVANVSTEEYLKARAKILEDC